MIANREAGRICFLAERLDKQNLLDQLDMANLKKLDTNIAVNEFDRCTAILGRFAAGGLGG